MAGPMRNLRAVRRNGVALLICDRGLVAEMAGGYASIRDADAQEIAAKCAGYDEMRQTLLKLAGLDCAGLGVVTFRDLIHDALTKHKDYT